MLLCGRESEKDAWDKITRSFLYAYNWGNFDAYSNGKGAPEKGKLKCNL